MITREKAIAIVAGYWNKDNTSEEKDFAPSSADLTTEKDYWLIYGNTKASVIDGIEMSTAVGISGFIVDTQTGELFIAGSLEDPLDILQDCRDDKIAQGKHYVLAIGSGEQKISDLTSLRKLFPCGIAKAKQLLQTPHNYWFTGKRRHLINYQNELKSLGMPSEVVLANSTFNAILIDSRSHFSRDLLRIEKHSHQK